MPAQACIYVEQALSKIHYYQYFIWKSTTTIKKKNKPAEAEFFTHHTR